MKHACSDNHCVRSQCKKAIALSGYNLRSDQATRENQLHEIDSRLDSQNRTKQSTSPINHPLRNYGVESISCGLKERNQNDRDDIASLLELIESTVDNSKNDIGSGSSRAMDDLLSSTEEEKALQEESMESIVQRHPFQEQKIKERDNEDTKQQKPHVRIASLCPGTNMSLDDMLDEGANPSRHGTTSENVESATGESNEKSSKYVPNTALFAATSFSFDDALEEDAYVALPIEADHGKSNEEEASCSLYRSDEKNTSDPVTTADATKNFFASKDEGKFIPKDVSPSHNLTMMDRPNGRLPLQGPSLFDSVGMMGTDDVAEFLGEEDGI